MSFVLFLIVLGGVVYEGVLGIENDWANGLRSTMFEVNITGVFMTAQAAAKQMIRFGNGGSIVMIASMSGTIANRVCLLVLSSSLSGPYNNTTRASSVPHTTPQKQESSSWDAISPWSGASTASELIPSHQATS